MHISIITAAYRAKYMDRVWSSIQKQTHKNWEWLIVNDGQRDIEEWYKNKRREESWDDHVWYVGFGRRKGRFGLYCRNVGAMVCRYDKFVFLDDDNEWEPDHLESLAKVAEETGKIPYCWMHYKGKKPGSTYDRIKKTGFAKQGIDLGCLLWDKSHFERFGYLRNDAQITFDWQAIKRVFDGLGGKKAFVSTNKPTLIFWHRRY